MIETNWNKGIKVTEVIGVAVLYFVFARIGQIFAIEPGNITPVWFPSGIMVALALALGARIWPGVFIGAFAGNVWAYYSNNAGIIDVAAIAAGTLNGVGDVLSAVFMAELIRHFAQTSFPLSTVRHLVIFVAFGGILGPLVSACFGVGGLSIFDIIPPEARVDAFITWFVGDTVGAIIYGPMILSYLNPSSRKYTNYLPVFIALIGFSGVVAAVVFGFLSVPIWVDYFGIALFPVFIILMVNYGLRVVFTILAWVSSIAIWATWQGSGPFETGTTALSLIQLQTFMMTLALVLYAVAVISFERQRDSEKLASQKLHLEKLYRQDPLTGVWNRYRIIEFLDHEFSRYKRKKQNFAVILMDLDQFKGINDKFGHNAGDEVLIEFSRLISTCTRESDLFGRWGGDEFIFVVSDTDHHSLLVLGKKICEIVDNHNFGKFGDISVSIGATIVRENDDQHLLISRADEAMYESKAEQGSVLTII